MDIFIVTHTKAGYNLNLSKDYDIKVFIEKTDAVQALKKAFYKNIEKTSLPQKKKEEITKTFSQNLLKGIFNYQFRDTSDPDEPQYFGKIHIRHIQ